AINSQVAVSHAFVKRTKIMLAANKSMNIEKISQQALEFQKQSETMNTFEELLNDSFEGVLGDSDQETEGEEILSQVLDEIGIEFGQSLTGASIHHLHLRAPKIIKLWKNVLLNSRILPPEIRSLSIVVRL
ncbi:Charged multivesicular body protein 2b, partial [Nowakowskiella sp. JEL0078]